MMSYSSQETSHLITFCLHPDSIQSYLMCNNHMCILYLCCHTLSSFLPSGKHQHTASLPYTPWWGIYRVTASTHHIYVVDGDRTKLHVHAHDTARHLTSLSLQQLQLHVDDRIWRVSYGDGGYLHVYSWNRKTKKQRISAYKIC